MIQMSLKQSAMAILLLFFSTALIGIPNAESGSQAQVKNEAATATQIENESDDQATTQKDLMEDKFQKLQKEMENEGGAQKNSLKANPSSKSSAPKPIGVIALAIQIFLGLIFVLILAVVTIRVLKKFQGRILAGSGKAGNFNTNLLEVMETCHLGSNQKVIAIRMHEEIGIIGVTPQGMSLLTMLKEPATEIRTAQLSESNSAAFSENLNKLLDRFKKPKRVGDLLDEAKK